MPTRICAEQLRKLIQAGVPLVVSHPVVESMLVYYELDMIRRESLCVVVPYLSARHHPAVRRLLDLADRGAQSPIGKIEQVVVGRGIAEPSKTNVLSQFARDADLIRGIAGDMTRLGAMAGSDGSSGYASLGVQMSGPSGIAARWSVDPTQPAHRAQLAVLGAQGKAVVHVAPEGEPWVLDMTVNGKTDTRTYPDWNPAIVTLEALRLAMAGEAAEPDWVDAARSIELAETIDRSLKKGRTIDLYYEDHTEEGTFKGIMASLGCGLLLVGLFLLGAVAIAEQMGIPYVQAWPYFLLGTLGVFLLMQLLMLVFRARDAARGRRPIGPRHASARLVQSRRKCRLSTAAHVSRDTANWAKIVDDSDCFAPR